MIQPSHPLQTRSLTKTLGGRIVLRGIDLKIAAGECVALTGGNGAGKTTLLRCLAAIARPTAGEVLWFGRPAAVSPDQRRLVGMVAHESRLYAHVTLRENLVFAARMWEVAAVKRRTDALLERIDLQTAADRQVRHVSKGMRQRLALARALMHEPPVLLLDEPFSGLDTTSSEWLRGLLQELKADGSAICLATHDLKQTRLLADRTLNLTDGVLGGGRVATVSSKRESVKLGTEPETE